MSLVTEWIEVNRTIELPSVYQKGAQGPQGFQGFQGPQGPQGPQGFTSGQSNLPRKGISSPDVIPDFIGQLYIDTLRRKIYVSVDLNNISDWVLLNP